MLKKITFSLFILLSCISSFAYYHFHLREHSGLTKEMRVQKWSMAKPDYSTLHSCDLIFRHGRGAISNLLMSFSRREAKYSHVGIISVENEKVFVYHAIGGEENISNKLRKDELEVFCNPNDIYSFGIYRLDLNDAQQQEVDSIVKNYYTNRLEFDTRFDFATNDKMYCSEFVYKVIMPVVRDNKYLSLSTVSGVKFVACDDLYLNIHSRFIYSYIY